MRRNLLTLLLLACTATPLQAQSCKKVPPPFLPSLFPENVLGMPLEFSSTPGGGCMSLYRPASDADRASKLWAVVTMDVNLNATLGGTAEGIREKATADGDVVLTMADWPVVFHALPKGDEYVALRGSVKVIVLVKNGDQGAASEAMAARFFQLILPKVPCG